MELQRVLLADDHALILESVRLLLRDRYEVAGDAFDGRILIAEAKRLQPNLILLDISLPRLNGLEAAQQIVRSVPEAKLVFCTQHGSGHYVQAAFRSGARGYVLKDRMQSELLPALSQVVRGEYYLSPRLLIGQAGARFNPEKNPSELFGDGISSLQEQILRALQRGRTDEDIACELHVPAATISAEIENLSGDWNAQNKDDLIRYGLSTGLLSG